MGVHQHLGRLLPKRRNLARFGKAINHQAGGLGHGLYHMAVAQFDRIGERSLPSPRLFNRPTPHRSSPSRIRDSTVAATAAALALWVFTYGYPLKKGIFLSNFNLTGGAGGIRTLDTPLQAYNGLANRRLQPLGHSSTVGNA